MYPKKTSERGMRWVKIWDSETLLLVTYIMHMYL